MISVIARCQLSSEYFRDLLVNLGTPVSAIGLSIKWHFNKTSIANLARLRYLSKSIVSRYSSGTLTTLTRQGCTADSQKA